MEARGGRAASEKEPDFGTMPRSPARSRGSGVALLFVVSKEKPPGMIPLLVHIPEDTHLRAFTFAALTVSLTTGIVLEYRAMNPFGTYVNEEGCDARRRCAASPRVVTILQTCAVAFCASMLSLVLLHLLFAAGEPMLALEAE